MKHLLRRDERNFLRATRKQHQRLSIDSAIFLGKGLHRRIQSHQFILLQLLHREPSKLEGMLIAMTSETEMPFG